MNSNKNIDIVDKIIFCHVVGDCFREQAGYLRKSTRQNKDTGGRKKTEVAVRQSKSTYTVVKSAMEFL